MLARRSARVGVPSLLRLAPLLRPQLSPAPPLPFETRGRVPRVGERSIFGLPTPSNEPLAGTIDGSGPPWLFLLQVFLGLPTLLWAYKCLVLIVFQRRIIYLPSVPPGTRDESLAPPNKALASQLNGLDWKEVTIATKGCTRWTRNAVSLRGLELRSSAASQAKSPQVVVIYLQGNAGTPLLRIPLFRRLLAPPLRSPPIPLTILAVAPRSFWLSTRTAPTEAGVLQDYATAIQHAFTTYPDSKFVLYGHSLGGAATLLLLRSPDLRRRISGVILENPLPSIPYMVSALYPQRWLPYHYLGPFVLDRWDAIGALKRGGALEGVPSLWIRSGSDEIIPVGGVEQLWEAAGEKEDGVERRWVDVKGALHDTALLERSWRDEVQGFLARRGGEAR